MDERREHERYELWFPVRLDADTSEEGMAVTHDASARGVLIAVARAMAVGTETTLTFRVPPDGDTETVVRGRVVRAEPNADDPDGLWPYRIAVEFERPIPELEALLQETTELRDRLR